MFKYNLEQLIWYMLNNTIHSASVLSRKYVDNLHNNWTSTKEQIDLFTHYGENSILYRTCHGDISESKAFATKGDLLINIEENKYYYTAGEKFILLLSGVVLSKATIKIYNKYISSKFPCILFQFVVQSDK